MNKRKREEDRYREFLQEPDREKEFRDKVLKPGVVHEIHLAGDTAEDFSNYYTKAEIDVLIEALGDVLSFEMMAVLGTL